jgi:hypothetical protein
LTTDATSRDGIILSIVVLNYNVKDFLENQLQSLRRASEGLSVETFVVDNASVDDSVDMVRARFPDVRLIVNDQNLGFSKGNNQVLRQCRGRYILMINPDTLVQEDTLTKMIEFMDAHPKAGAASCKVLNSDGSLQLTCKRSFPTPWVAFTKIAGLSQWFPKSRLFGRYNLTYLDENEIHAVEAIAGSFMFLRREVLDTAGYLDETFFMYGEDLDWCYRIWEAGWKIYYVPTTSIIHYKGESTSRSGFDDIRAFYEAMLIFVEKHFKWRYSFWLIWTLKLAIWTRAVAAVLSRVIRRGFAPLLDIVFINLSLTLAILIRYGRFITPEWIESTFVFYTTIHVSATVVWTMSLALLGNYGKRPLSISQSLLAAVVGFFVVSTASLFSKEFVFSRMAVLLTSGFVLIFVVAWRVVALFVTRRGASSNLWSTKVFKRHTLIVGTDKVAVGLSRRIRSRFDNPYLVLGHVTVPGEAVSDGVVPFKVLGGLLDVPDLIRKHRVSEIIVCTDALSNNSILQLIQSFAGEPVRVKLVPRGTEVVLGKSHITRVEDLPVFALDAELDRPVRRWAKRALDIHLSLVGLAVLFPWRIIAMFRRSVEERRIFFRDEKETVRSAKVLTRARTGKATWFSTLRLILTGRISFVGPRWEYAAEASQVPTKRLFLKPGVFSLGDVTRSGDETDWPDPMQGSYDAYYAQNYSVKMDLEIIVRGLLRL